LHAIGQQHALGRGFVEQGFGLAFALALQSGHGGFVGTQGRQLQQCSRGLALGIQRHGDRHQLLRDRLVFGLGQHFGDVHGQTAGRGVGRQARLGRCQQSLGLELLEETAAKASPSFCSALGGSSSTNSSTSRFDAFMMILIAVSAFQIKAGC
jgi:hypothetical protein